MNTGIGLTLLGMWVAVAACWHSDRVPGPTALTATVIALIYTTWAFVK